MLITLDLMRAVGACEDGCIVGVALGCSDLNIEAASALLESNGHKEYAEWVRDLVNNPTALKFVGEYASISYYVFNPVSNIYLTTSELAHVDLIKKSIISENPDVNQKLITVQEVLTTLDGRNLRQLISSGTSENFNPNCNIYVGLQDGPVVAQNWSQMDM